MLGTTLRHLDGPVFLTGHTGFKGSWLGMLLKHLSVEFCGYSLDAEKGSLFERADLNKSSTSFVGDVRNFDQLQIAMNLVKPSVVIHLAAQALVLKSYEEPLTTFQTNCIGTANVLQAAFYSQSVQVVLVITTDKVYLNDNSGKRFCEVDALGGNDPYSASKVAAEAACAAWRQISKTSGGPKVLVARAGNVIGGGDYANDRLIPDIIRAVMTGKKLSVRKPNATRPWQHVLDLCVGYLQYLEWALQNSEVTPSLNFGPIESSYSVEQVINLAKENFREKLLINYAVVDENEFESDFLQLDVSRAFREINWYPKWNQSEAINLTFSWWKKVLSNPSEVKNACSDDIKAVLSSTPKKNN